jgi:hypothetical protein
MGSLVPFAELLRALTDQNKKERADRDRPLFAFLAYDIDPKGIALIL